MKRDVVVVDVETTGFDPTVHVTVEVAWWNLTADERGAFIPQHDVRAALAGANIRSLQITRYVDRIAEAKQDDGTERLRLWHQLNANTMAGSNPRFDAGFLAAMNRGAGQITPEPWHYRLWDLSAYAAGRLGLDYLPGLFEVCELVDVPTPDHSAEADVTATGLCFRKLMEMVP